MDDCIEFFESFPDAFTSDKQYCQWLRIQHIAEDVGLQLSMDDPSVTVSVVDFKVQLALKVFERQFDEWRAQLPKEVDNRECSVASELKAAVSN